MYKKKVLLERLDAYGRLLVPQEIRNALGLTGGYTLEIGLLSNQPGF